MRIFWTPLAERTYYDNLVYLEKNWPESVIENFIAEVEKILTLLEVDPEIFRLWEKEIKVRVAPINKHTSLFYHFDKNVVSILLFWNHKRNPDSLRNFF